MSETAHPNLNLTAEEKRVFYQYFQAADTTSIGVVTGETAVPFFEKTKLPPDTLGLIWQLADKENRGLLTPSGFSIVLRLIGHAQAGRVPTEELALQPGPLPRFEGLQDAPPSRPATASPPPSAPGGPIRVPPLSPEDVNKFSSLFEKSDTPNGMITGETAKQIFERARLPNEVLGRIWNLADTKQRGQLDVTDFVIAMHLLTSYKTGSMRGIPQTLPPGLYEAAARRGLVRTSTGPRAVPEVPPVPAIPTQYTGPRTQSPLTRPPFGSPLSAQSTGGDWMISPQEKAHFDSIFATVDTAKAGIISGDQAVTFFTNAQLPEDVLAQIWDLADIDADGQLTRDEFAVAMYLVRQQRSRKEPVPAVLPPALIPPSMRRQTAVPRPAAVPPAPAPAPAPAAAPLPRSAAEDLFGLDAFNTPAPAAPTQFPQSTGGSNPPFQSPGSPSSRTSQQAPSTTFKPFVPSSHFGQSLGPQLTGIGSATRSPPPPSDDLLGDNDPEESKKLTQETSELANLSNQIGSLAKEMQNVQTQRASAEQDLTQTSQQKRDFEARLAQARSMYEKEVKDFKALEERLNASRAETKKFQQEYALLEGSRQDLQSQYEQVSAALASDQNENANLKEKIRQVNAVVSQLKPALEKARSEARQHKGLVAINKKQLATVEGERDKIQGEIETFAKEKENYAEPAQPVTQPADIASPALSTVSQQTNPFFKRQTTGSSERTLPPSPHPQAAFDNLFGPSFTSPTTSTPPPAISFGAGPPSVQHTSDVSRSPDISGIPTPSVSPGPQAVSEPPPPPQSRQITSSSLPLGSETHAASVTSSTAVSPPASRFGGGPDASEAGTPLQPASANAVSGSVDNDNDLPSAPATEKSVALSPFDEIPEPSAAPENAENAVSTGEDQAQPFPHMPGSLPVETPPANHEAAATAESANPAKDTSFDELFGNVSRERSQSQKANDFEEAFAGMKPRNTPPANASNGAGTGEFPPIKELEDDDDDDDSTDDGAPMGFDDNFTPTSPPHKEERSHNESIDATQLHAFPAPGNGATSPQPPPVEAQRSPPSYDNSRATDESGDFPRAFDGLLPSRADPTLAPDAPHAVESSSGAPIVAGEAQEKTTDPDFDAAFAQLDLAPAKEEDDSDDEDIVDPHSHRQGTDFDFSFDSPSQSLKAVTSPSAQPGAPNAAAAEFFNFDHNVPTSTTQAATSPSTTQPAASGTATDHDWDAIFAPLKDTQFTVGESNGAAAHSAESKAATSSDSRPPGWALDAGTGEDDLILQRLTGMGYARDESLAALEKFDYNIDKAADYLTSRS